MQVEQTQSAIDLGNDDLKIDGFAAVLRTGKENLVNRDKNRTHSLALGTLLVAALCLVATGPAVAAPKVASMSASATSLDFSVLVEYRRLVLNVSGGGRVTTQTFGPGESVQLDVSGLADGHYTYELRAERKIDEALMAELEARRGPGGLEGAVPAGLEPIVQTGYLTIADGMVVRDDLPEEPAEKPISMAAPITSISAADFVINDDLIVDGSACIGFDCVNGESFGFDTIRLKENNLRIKFDDTSVAASYPDNDWQLTANDSANGGAAKFSIDDISGNRTPFTVEANARSHSLYVDDGGRIGSRTSTPSVEIHTIDGDTPTLRLQQDGSSGFTPQTWDVAGNETNFFIRDVTNGSQLPFRIRPDAPTSSIFIDVDGDIGMGTSSPAEALHVSNNGALNVQIENSSGSGGSGFILIGNSGFSGSAGQVLQDGNGDLRMRVIGGTASGITVEQGTGNVGINTTAPTGTLEVNGTIVVTGSGQVHPDYVFESDYELETIEEHAASMWKNKSLPAVGPGQYDEEGRAIIELGASRMSMLEELEKAHVYIEQINDEVKSLNDRLESKDATISALVERLERLEATVSGVH